MFCERCGFVQKYTENETYERCPECQEVYANIGTARKKYEHSKTQPVKSRKTYPLFNALTVSNVEVWFPNGATKIYKNLSKLVNAIRLGKVRKMFRARAIEFHKDLEKSNTISAVGNWVTVGHLAKKCVELRKVFQPKWASARGGIRYGIGMGVLIWALLSSYTLFLANNPLWVGLGIHVVVYVLCFLTLGSGGLLGFAIILFGNFASIFFPNLKWLTELFVHGFMAFIGAAIVGATFGAPIGMIIGTIVGHIKANKLSKTVDIDDEGLRPYVLGIALPLCFLAITVPLYLFWFFPKLLEWLA